VSAGESRLPCVRLGVTRERSEAGTEPPSRPAPQASSRSPGPVQGSVAPPYDRRVGECLICERVALAKGGNSPFVIAEMERSYFVVGDHQWHEGYALVLLKEHVREPFELEPDVQREHFREVMRAAQALYTTFRPRKMNFSCYGNAEPHVHWHLVPRYKEDPHPTKDPWEDIARFHEKAVAPEQAREIAARIRGNLG
jgi:diadenosine tetraphosphate (Ap4A) HIT family hydrolase